MTHYMHGPLGMFAQRNPDASWDWMLHDGLGSVRGVFDGTLQSAAEYDPFGEPIVAPVGTAYGFTGELTDGNGLLYLRARYLAPALGTFASRDPWRGTASAPRTWNGYAWVEGNVVNRVDGSGMQSCFSSGGGASVSQQTSAPLTSIPQTSYDLLEKLCRNMSRADRHNRDVVDAIDDTDLALSSASGLFKLLQQSVPGWLQEAQGFVGKFTWISDLGTVLSAFCAARSGDILGAAVEGLKLVPIVGIGVTLFDEVLLNKEEGRKNLPRPHNPELARCYSPAGVGFPTRETLLAELYMFGCNNEAICRTPHDALIKAGLQAIDRLQSSGRIPVDLASATPDEIRGYSYLISEDPVVNLESGKWGDDILRFGVAPFLLLARNLQSGHPTNTDAFADYMESEWVRYPPAADRTSWRYTVRKLREADWQNNEICH